MELLNTGKVKKTLKWDGEFGGMYKHLSTSNEETCQCRKLTVFSIITLHRSNPIQCLWICGFWSCIGLWQWGWAGVHVYPWVCGQWGLSIVYIHLNRGSSQVSSVAHAHKQNQYTSIVSFLNFSEEKLSFSSFIHTPSSLETFIVQQWPSSRLKQKSAQTK